MSERKYRLKRGEPVPVGVARVAYGRIYNAVDELDDQTDSSPAEAVHTARKDMKKLRALLRLVRGEIGGEVYRRESAAFRDAARELSGVRDADVMIATLDSLDLPDGADGPLRQALEAHRIRTAAGGGEEAANQAMAILGPARERVADWPLQTDGFAAFDSGLRRTYTRGRRAFRTAQEDPSAENLHDWRKRTKDLWYHLTLLEDAWPPVMMALADEAHELSDRLGDDHDLAVLLEWAREHADSAAIDTAVAERREHLQSEAFAYGERLYADKPKSFTGRLERWWNGSVRAVGAEAVHH